MIQGELVEGGGEMEFDFDVGGEGEKGGLQSITEGFETLKVDD